MVATLVLDSYYGEAEQIVPHRRGFKRIFVKANLVLLVRSFRARSRQNSTKHDVVFPNDRRQLSKSNFAYGFDGDLCIF